MKKTTIGRQLVYALALAGLLAVSSCKTHPHGGPPGQVKKVTGVHPVTGKPNQNKAKTAPAQKKNNNKTNK